MAQGDSGTSVARRLAFPLAALVVIAVHLALIAHFVGVTVFLDDAPGFALDFDTHISQTWRVIEGLDGWRRSWVYDVQLLAGAPTGAIFDADNKAWELWTYALWKLGMSKGAAFDLFPLVAHLLVLPVVYGAARLFGLGRGGALFATGLG